MVPSTRFTAACRRGYGTGSGQFHRSPGRIRVVELQRAIGLERRLSPGQGDEEQDAVVSLIKQRYPGAVGRIVAVKIAPVIFRKAPGRVDVEVPGVAKLSERTAVLPEDAYRGATQWYEPFIPLTEATLAATTLYDYEGVDFSKQWQEPDAGITGYFGRFTLKP